MKKLASGSRTTFVSPYLLRPLRSLNKVLGERDGEGEVSAEPQAANDGETGQETLDWQLHRKSSGARD